MSHTQTNSNRIVYLDLARIAACFLVVTVHVSALQIDTLPLRSFDYFITNAWNCLGFLGVTLFVMISGALVLGRRAPVQPHAADCGANAGERAADCGGTHSIGGNRADQEQKRRLATDPCAEEHGTGECPPDGIGLSVRGAVRFFALYYIWKALYQLIDLADRGIPLSLSAVKNDVLLALVKQRGYYHLWFLPMIALLYLTVPVIKKAVQSRRVCEYFLCIFFVTALLFPTLFHYEFKFKYLFVDFFAANDFSFFGGYLGYFILGHYLNRFTAGANRPKRIALYVLGALGFVLSCVLGFRYSLSEGSAAYPMNTPLTPMMFFTACAVFTAFRQADARLAASARTARPLRTCAGLTLGVYLLHPAVLLLAEQIGFVPSLFSPALSIPLITVCVTLLCGLVSLVLSKIPILRRLIR